jgi:hypothetical protein
MLGDSGGFQILKCQWPADWKDINCPRAMKKRKQVLTWMDTYMDYGMCLDIPSQSLTTFHIQDPKTKKSAHGISTIEEAITATHINNEYFIKNRNGKCKFLNVLQGRNHTQSDDWYAEMKKYCDPNVYPDNHFNGWAFGGQNKIDVHLMLTRMIDIIHDGLLQPGKHDLIHCLGTSILEYAVLFTDIQKAIRKYHNPNLQITFDCASPFFSAAKGLAYFNTSIEHNKKWSYSMEKTAEKKSYSNDTRKFRDAVLAEGIHAKMTALMTNAKFGADVIIGAASNFDASSLQPILALGKNYDSVRLLLDGAHLAYLLPTTRESFTIGEPGAYGFDGGIYKNNLWTSAATDIAGFVCGPDAIVNAWGVADGLPAGEAISQTTMDVNGIPFTMSVWFSRASRSVWASFQVMHGCAVGDATQAEVLTTA